MDVSLGYIIDHLQIIIFICLGILDIILDYVEICRVYEYAPYMDLASLNPMRLISFSSGQLQG